MKPENTNLLALEAKDARIKELEEENSKFKSLLETSEEALENAFEQGNSSYYNDRLKAREEKDLWREERDKALGKDHS